MAKLLAGLILCGGRSQRMGRDKGLLLYQGRPLVKRAYATLALRMPTFVSLRPAQKKTYGRVVSQSRFIFDREMRIQGPLRGLLSAHVQYPHFDFLVSAVDLPLLQVELLEKLRQIWQGGHNDAALCYSYNDKKEPMPAIYGRTLLARAFLTLPEGFSLKRQLGQARALSLSDEQALQLANVNRPQALLSLPF